MRELERLQWLLWQGNVSKALQVVLAVEMDLDAVAANGNDGTARKLLKGVGEFHTDIENCKGSIRNSGERYRHGERSSTGFVKLTVNQVERKYFRQKQQMPGGMPGAHLLLHTWVKTLNGELGAGFRSWYPELQLADEPQAAWAPEF